MSVLRPEDSPHIDGTKLVQRLNVGYACRIDALGNGVLRIAVLPSRGPEIDRVGLVTPDDDVDWGGRQRLSVDGFETHDFDENGHKFVADGFEVSFAEEAFGVTITRNGRTLLQDRPGHAWRWSPRKSQLTHYSLLGEDPAHYGLGDASGPLDRTGRRIRCLSSDALGYNAETSDPLYKHVPFVICGNGGKAFGLLYDTMAETAFDLGAEHSNYFPRYRHVTSDEDAIVLYLLDGPRVADVVSRLYRITGKRAFPPRWSLGFAFTSMHHADAPDAQNVISDFACEARAKDLPISAIHLGSGYSAKSDGLRYVFNWNENRFPDRAGFFAALRDEGFYTVANVKPVLLTGHDAHQRAADEGWFVQRENGTPAIERFWDGWGASLDMTNASTRAFWHSGITNAVLGEGFDAVWNDNNEGELWDETATIAGEDGAGSGARLPGMACRPVHALLMTRTSYEATLTRKPQERPYTISRAGPIGLARYGETWSGDNATSWPTLKWNLRQGLSMSLSGIPLVGHDIGGFVGAPPDPELLTRWFEMMALHPRCVMNSWKADHGNIPNLPWMHEAAFPAIKQALNLRYALLPYLYSCIYRSHAERVPVIAPTFYHFDDPACRDEADTFMVGDDLLVAPVVSPGADHVKLYLPEGTGWTDFHNGEHFEGGEKVTLPAPPGQPPILVRDGAVIPIATHWPETAPHDATNIELRIFAGQKDGTMSGSLFFDDGRSWDYRDGRASLLTYECAWTARFVEAEFREGMSGENRPSLDVRLNAGDERKLSVSGLWQTPTGEK